MTTVNEYNAETKKYNDVTYCDDCRAEILAFWLGHRNVFDYDDICVSCYDKRRFEYATSIDGPIDDDTRLVLMENAIKQWYLRQANREMVDA